MRSTFLHSGVAAMALMGLIPMPAQAAGGEAGQSSVDGENADLQAEIVVTATRRKETVLSIPTNISAVSGGALTAAGVTDAAGISRLVPGLVMLDEGVRASGNRNTFNIRGLNANSATNNDDNPDKNQDTVSTYFGETPVFFPFKLVDIERVEVLRGPQGTLYGSGSVGGTVRFIPVAPDFSRFSASATAEMSFSEHASKPGGNISATLNIPLSSTVAVRLNAGHDYQAGWIDAVGLIRQTGTARHPGAVVLADPGDLLNSPPASAPTRKDANAARVDFVRGAVRIEPSDTLEITLNGLYQKNHAGNRNEDNPFFEGKAYRNYKAFLDPQDSRIFMGDADVSLDVGFATLTSATTYTDIETHSVSDASGFLRTNLSDFYFGYPRLYAPGVRDSRTKTFSQELRLVSSTQGPVDYVAGMFFLRRKLDFNYDNPLPGINDYTNAVLGLNPPLDFTDVGAYGGTQQVFKELAGFGEVTWHVTSKLDVTGGARLFQQRQNGVSGIPLPFASRTTQYFIEGVATDDFYLGGFTPFRYRKTSAIYKANLAYKFSKRMLAYATWSQGFRAGGSNALPASDPFGNDNRPYLTYKPDKVNNFEIGLKGSSQAFDYTVTAFHIDWTNFQTNLFTEFGVGYIANVPKTKSDGVEMQFGFRPAQGVSATLGYTYLDARVASPFELMAGDPSTLIDTGARLPSSSRHTISASGDYSFQLGDLDARLHSDISYRSRFNSSFADFPALSTNIFYRFKPITVVNMSFSLSKGPVQGVFFVNNLGNSRGTTTTSPASLLGVRDQGYGVIRPRTIGLRLTWSGL